jgi:hypothetical protein
MWYYTCKKTKFLLSKGPSIGSFLLFVRGATCVKSRYKPYVSGSIHPLCVDREDYPMLSWAGASDQIENVSSLAGDLTFLLFGLESLFDLCY